LKHQFQTFILTGIVNTINQIEIPMIDLSCNEDELLIVIIKNLTNPAFSNKVSGLFSIGIYQEVNKIELNERFGKITLTP
jgi:hypothetical protein